MKKGFLYGIAVGIVVLFLDWFLPHRGCVFGIESYVTSYGCLYTHTIHPFYIDNLYLLLSRTSFSYLAWFIYLTELGFFGLVGIVGARIKNSHFLHNRSIFRKCIALMFFLLLVALIAPFKYLPLWAFTRSSYYCSSLVESVDRDNCWVDLSISKRSLSYCGKIENLDSKKYCDRTAVVHNVMYKNVPLSECEKIEKDSFEQGECYQIFAEKNDDVNVCYKIKSETALSGCIGHFTYQTVSWEYKPKYPDISICDRVSDEYPAVKDGCYLRLVTQGELYDPSICDKMSGVNSNYKPVCYEYFEKNNQ